MYIEINIPPELPPLMPPFVAQSFERLRVQAKKVNDTYLVRKKAIVASMKKLRCAFVDSAKFIESHPLIPEELVLPETGCKEVE